MKSGRVVLRVEMVLTKVKAAILLACAFVPFLSKDLASESEALRVFYPVQYSSNNNVSSNYFVAGSTSVATLSIGDIPSVTVSGSASTVQNVPGIQVVGRGFSTAELVISNGLTTLDSGKSAIRIRSVANSVAQPIVFFPDTPIAQPTVYQLYLKDFCVWRTSCLQYETALMVNTDGSCSADGYCTYTGNEILRDQLQLCCKMTTEQPPI